MSTIENEAAKWHNLWPSRAVTLSAARTHLPVTRLGWTAHDPARAASSIPVAIAGVTMLADTGGNLY